MASRRTPDIHKPADPAPRTDIPTIKPPPPPRVPKSPLAGAPRVQVTPEERRRLIAESAYLRAERRGFAPGHEADDWFAAEAEVDALLRVGGSPRQ
jgi:hypothetical protein